MQKTTNLNYSCRSCRKYETLSIEGHPLISLRNKKYSFRDCCSCGGKREMRLVSVLPVVVPDECDSATTPLAKKHSHEWRAYGDASGAGAC